MLNLTHIRFEPAAKQARPRNARHGQSVVRFLPEVATAKWPEQWSRLLQNAGIEVEAYKVSALERRMSACLRRFKAKSIQSVVDLTRTRPALVREIPDTLLLGVSNFFRDPQLWSDLDQKVLPELLTGRSGLDILSAGCSDGQELYSFAMLLGEYGVLTGSRLTGMDCRENAILSARTGMYPTSVLKDVPPSRWRFFERAGKAVRVIEPLRASANWTLGNVLKLCDLNTWDVILFRNLAIYFNDASAGEVWPALVAALKPNGVLVTGKAEKPPRELGMTRLSPCIYRKLRRAS